MKKKANVRCNESLTSNRQETIMILCLHPKRASIKVAVTVNGQDKILVVDLMFCLCYTNFILVIDELVATKKATSKNRMKNGIQEKCKLIFYRVHYNIFFYLLIFVFI